MDEATRDELDAALEGDLALDAADAEGITGGGDTGAYCARCGHRIGSHQMYSGRYYCQTTGTHFCG
jgi:hypothetical protein